MIEGIVLRQRRQTVDAGQSDGVWGLVVASAHHGRLCRGGQRDDRDWSNHPDATSALLPVGPRYPGRGRDSITVTTFNDAQNYFPPNFNGDASNGINRLYAQLLAAKLNIKSGANGSAVATTIASADSFLATHSAGDWSSLTLAQRNGACQTR
ncbi:hypothetical protein [Actinomadura bangladeshensis]|uniref:Uncharacterized protein n=1 Tax=Actinomadura bangladeshensis TaxID=453573 RepID=A0A4R4P6A7_9ACTN|nr:hypothetical protein [Actinomadura bangladeshensis]TDC17264.1 hypothetical protein E1284_09970 [Actinomadura bangladeshensis]